MNWRLLATFPVLLLGACAAIAHEPPSLDALAREYLAVQLAIGEKEPGYVDSYYGPPDLAAEAKAQAASTSLQDLQARVSALDAALAALPAAPGTREAGRAHFLRAMLDAAAVRLRMLRGETIPFADEAEALYGVRPDQVDLATLDPVLERIETLVPGEGALAERVNAFNGRFMIPADRLQAVYEVALAECRRRTLAHIPLPENERFDFSFVTNQIYGGVNYYRGDYRSEIAINTDLPSRINDAVEYGCHEAYPGHHVLSLLLERDRVRARGEVEHTLLALYSPTALVIEGSAEYGIKMAFPGNEQFLFERDVIAPLAGIDTSELEKYYALRDATMELHGAYDTIAASYLDGRISREQAASLLMRYILLDRDRAEQQLRFMESVRSFVVNYNLGVDLVARFIEAGDPDMATRWQRFAAIIDAPTLPEDLRPAQ